MDAKAVRVQLDSWWGNKAHAKLDWLRFEQFTADVLSSVLLSDSEKAKAMREGLDAFTRRGHFEHDSYFPTLETVV